MTATISVVSAAAWHAYDAGLCVVPPTEDGRKKPIGTWKQYQSERPSREQMERWYGDEERDGVGAVTGRISGNLEVFEFDNLDAWKAFCRSADEAGLGELVDRLRHGYEEATPGGGIHWPYYCEEIAGNTELARRPGPLDENGRPTIDVLIETRGEGGYIVLAPSRGAVHPSGKAYRLLHGSFETIPTITPAERRALWNHARTFDEMPVAEAEEIPASRPRTLSDDDRPGDDFNQRGNWRDILEPAGWILIYRRGDKTFWRRPGKPAHEPGHSAVTGYTNADGADRFVCYSTSTIFDANKGYSKFRAYALLHHAGDHRAAARELRRQGYGKQDAPIPVSMNGYGKHDEIPPPAEETANEPQRFALTDTGNAERLVYQYGRNLRFNWGRGVWHVWSGKHWQEDNAGRMEQLAKATARAIPAEAAGLEGDAYTKVLKWAASSESNDKRQSLVKLARSEDGIPVQPAELDANPWLLNVANGTLDLRTGQLRDHRRDDLITRLIDVPYDPDATCPTFERFISDLMNGNAELIAYVQRAIGYALTGSTREQCVFIAYGTGSNGKSTLLGTIRNLLGDYAREADADSFMEKRNEAIREDIAALDGARFVAASETSDGKRLSEALVKKMTGGERLRARKLYENGYEFQPQFKVWLSTNHRPEIRGTEHAIWRRIRLIPFTVTFEDDQKDQDMPAKLAAELPGILAWAVRGCMAWQREGLREPKAITEATADYRRDMDILSNWIDDRCELGPRFSESSKALYADYVAYCEANGDEPIKQRTFGIRLTERGCGQSSTGSARLRTGIRLKGEDGETQQTFSDATDRTDAISGNSYIETDSSYLPDSSVSSVSSVNDDETDEWEPF